MNDRKDLDEVLASIIDMTEPDGDRHTYLNPPPSVRMRYPAIKYSLNNVDLTFANDGVYRTIPSYQVILIDDDPDSIYVGKILQIPYCSFNSFYIADNLNHWVFTIYDC